MTPDQQKALEAVLDLAEAAAAYPAVWLTAKDASGKLYGIREVTAELAALRKRFPV
jgi:hypothetical protein